MSNGKLCMYCKQRSCQEGNMCYHCKNYPEERESYSITAKLYNTFLYGNAPPLEDDANEYK